MAEANSGSQLVALFNSKSEALEVDYKSWMDTTQTSSKAKLAKHLAALANNGGGYLVWGVDDTTRIPVGASPFDASCYSQDSIFSIVKRYLEPAFQCRVEWVSLGGVDYPVWIVPGHGAHPIVAKADGPHDSKGQPIGIRKGSIYVRVAGPESAPIDKPEQWSELLERCLMHRSDLLSKIMRQAVGRPAAAKSHLRSALKAAGESTADDFSGQAARLVAGVEQGQRHLYAAMPTNFAVHTYCLVDAEGNAIELPSPLKLVVRADVGMHAYAFNGWSNFVPLHVAERAPQMRIGKLLGEDASYLEGMRLDSKSTIFAASDYWRVYQKGFFCTAESYREDYMAARDKAHQPFITVLHCLMKLHSVLTHARLTGQENPDVGKVLFCMDWRGMKDRFLADDGIRAASYLSIKEDRIVQYVEVSWAEVRDNYFSALRRLALPLLRFWEAPHGFDAETWLSRDRVAQRFANVHSSFKLFDDDE